MSLLRSLVAASLLFLSAHAHFELVQPPPLEGDSPDESLQPNGPCGGGVADLSQNTAADFHVDGDAVALALLHPQAKFLIRATLDSHAAGNWTQLHPIYQQNSRGNLCQPAITAPKDWAGQKGIIGIACAAPDGLLYQCAAVNFVEGVNSAPASCTNGSSVTANFDDDATLSALVDDGNSTTTDPDSSATGSTTTALSPAESTSDSAAPAVVRGSGLPIGSLAVAAVMVMVGAAVL